jgi:hypothetical protein
MPSVGRDEALPARSMSDHARHDLRGARRRRGYCPRQVPLTPIVVHVVRPGARSDALLAALASHLGREVQPPDERGHVRILLEEPLAPAWQHVHDGLAAVGDDWQEHLQLNPLPD